MDICFGVQELRREVLRFDDMISCSLNHLQEAICAHLTLQFQHAAFHSFESEIVLT